MPRLRLKLLAEAVARFSPKEIEYKPEDLVDSGQTLTEWLWTETEEIREKIMDSVFVKGVANGALDPTTFGAFNVQDVKYCSTNTEALRIAAKRASGKIKKYLEGRINSYEHYSEEIMKFWHINSPDAVNVGKHLEEYIKLHFSTAKDDDPIYSIVALIPCERLWPWIGGKIKDVSSSSGVYGTWISDNFYGDGYKSIEAFINSHVNVIDDSKALEIYKSCMNGEYSFFNAPF